MELKNWASRLARLRTWTLWALVVLSLALHSHFVLEGCGEQDEARLAENAFAWHLTGEADPEFCGYRVSTSPLYLHGLKKMLDWGVPRRALPDLLNWSNVVFGTLTLIPMYLLLRRLSNEQAALAACVLYSFAPTFWLANVYGMPHLPSFGLFLASLLAFVHALKGSRRRSAVGAALAGLCLAGAVALKADIVLCAGAFAGVLIVERRLTARSMTLAAVLVGLSVAVVVSYSRLVAPPGGLIPASDAPRSSDLPLEAAKAFSAWNLRVTARAFGPVLFAAALLAVLYSAAGYSASRRLLLVALLWSVPPQIVWGMKFGNSARHMMPPALPLVALVAVALAERVKRARWRWPLIAVLLLGNYYSTAKDSRTVAPSTQIFGSAARMQERIDCLHEGGRKFAALTAPKILLVGISTNPYAVYEILANARGVRLRPGACNDFVGEMVVETKDGRFQLIRWIYGLMDTVPDVVATARREGWLVWTMEPDTQSDP